ncbi:MAG: hypothetical protein ACR2KG_12150 [Nocardioidaceae bacterium]
MSFEPTNLDWSDPKHWRTGKAALCIYCGVWTPLLDNTGRPAHKACVEHAIDAIRARKEQTS